MHLLATLLFVFFGQVLFAADCMEKIQQTKQSLEQISARCAKQDLSTDYVYNAEPNRARFIQSCISSGNACMEACKAADAKTVACYKAGQLKKNPIAGPQGVIQAADSMIDSNNLGIKCLEASLESCLESRYSAIKTCAAAEEGIFITNENCDVDLTNLAVQLRNSECSQTQPQNQAAYDSAKEDLQTEIKVTARKIISWGKSASQNTLANKVRCDKFADDLIFKKNQTIKELMKSSKEAFKTKTSVRSQ
jgi:hypothetical protein